MNDTKLNFLIEEFTINIVDSYKKNLIKYPYIFEDVIDTSPLLNLTVSVFIGSLLHYLDIIKKNTIGEIQLIENIDALRDVIIKSISNLPFIKSIDIK